MSLEFLNWSLALVPVLAMLTMFVWLDVFKLTKWEIVNPRVTWLSEGSAIVNYAWTGTGTLFDQPVAPMQAAITVWTRRNGKWLAVSHQQTELVNLDAR